MFQTYLIALAKGDRYVTFRYIRLMWNSYEDACITGEPSFSVRNHETVD